MNKDYLATIYEDGIVLTHVPSKKEEKFTIEFPWGRKMDIVTQILMTMGIELKVKVEELGKKCPSV
jgi:hypothetical protein